MLGEVRAWIRREQGHGTWGEAPSWPQLPKIISGPASDMLAPLHIAVPSWCLQASFACRTDQQRHGDGDDDARGLMRTCQALGISPWWHRRESTFDGSSKMIKGTGCPPGTSSVERRSTAGLGGPSSRQPHEENRTLQHNRQKCFGGPISPILVQKCTKTPEGCHSPPSSSNHFWSERDTDDERSDDWPSAGVLFRISL